MIKGILIVNNHGKPRIVKFYEHVPDAEQQAVIRDIYTQVSKRPDTLCNFLEGTYVKLLMSAMEIQYRCRGYGRASVRYWGSGVKLIYRHYATLYFVFAVDKQESDLGILDLIQETLDKIFENVCELDLIFHSDKVHYALDEIVMGGMVLETNINEVLTAVNEMNRKDNMSSRRSLQSTIKK
ncbi:hypothetical protein KXD40_005706 [Peronospora effusa]|uniref:AP complex subunit sigma n=1 Tax=Peronospora effusa TaxID=542832 RepID=A0A3M6VE90_9STRA|nr:hypothetical protein DD238_003670 [Peronospora effusa]RQM15592.1 hypothetical protein DD237_003512 [Peronospora effusa]UIZ27484.1 hypothetical protein KXD40_005706 [Peronospora effusa]